MPRLEIKDNYLYIIDNSTEEIISKHPSKDTRVMEYDETSENPLYVFNGIESNFNSRSQEDTKHYFDDLLDLNGDAFTTIDLLRTFINQNTAGFSISQAGETLDNFFVADYADTSTTASPINISVENVNVNTWIDLPNNGLGIGSFNDLPNGVDIIDVLTGYFDFTSIPQGSKIDIRLDLTVTTTTPNTVVQARLLQAVGDALERPVIFAHRFYKSSKTAVSYVFSTTFDVTSDAFYLNPSKLQILADDASVIINNGVRCWITYK